ncbi:LysR family transcriptional regulator [Acidocella sp.]|uniref:LysR family transcriptional regulator n=1 Tax=Acidocella sp. TaxID=50710 RepID=UPI0026209749|nr:LysR family transcriptional regulator [Acidocella sp.]
MDRIGKMVAFAKVVESGSFVQAARQLRLSPSIVSRHVRELEDWLGARLLTRTTRHVSLTEIGAVFYERCASLLHELDALEATAGRLQTTPRGTLRVSAPLALGATRVAALLPGFSRDYPDITIELILTDRAVDIVEEGFDLALTMDELTTTTAITRLLCHTRSVLCAAPAYLAAHGAPATLADLKSHNILAYSTALFAKGALFTGPEGHTETIRAEGSLRTNSAIALHTAALGGLGLAMLPDFLVHEALTDGRLTALLPAWRPPDLPIRLVYPPGRNLPAKTRAFADYLIKTLGARAV